MRMEGARDRLDADLFNHVVGHFGAAVTVITAADRGRTVATTADAVSSLSLSPPTMLVCVASRSDLSRIVQRTGLFAVNVLGENQEDLAADLGAGQVPSWLQLRPGEVGQPLLESALAQLECRVTTMADTGTHTIFFAEVATASAHPGAPLMRFRGKLGHFIEIRDDLTYQELRKAVLNGYVSLSDVLQVDELAAELGVAEASVASALTRLAQDGLVTRCGPAAYLVTPVDEALFTNLLRARVVLMAGIVDQVIDGMDDERLARVRASAEDTRPRPGIRDIGMSNEQSVQSFRRFNEALVELTGNDVLLDFYRRLSVHTVSGRILQDGDWSELHKKISEQALRVADSLERRDRDATVSAIVDFNEVVREHNVALIDSAGGRI